MLLEEIKNLLLEAEKIDEQVENLDENDQHQSLILIEKAKQLRKKVRDWCLDQKTFVDR